MARTYRVYGCTHDTSGSLDVTLSVGGNEVFNGPITADTTQHSEDPLEVSHIFSFDVDDSLTGNQNWNMTVSGTDDSSEIHISHLECNNVRPNMSIALEYFIDKIEAMENPTTDGFAVDQQAYVANTLGEAKLGTEVYNKLLAGTSTPNDDATAVMTANELEGKDSAVYYRVDGEKTSVQLDGEPYTIIEGGTVPVHHGQTMTCTWDMTPQVFAYDPPLPA